MSQDLGNINIILSSTLNMDNEKNKSELNKENNFYSLINKKRKRNYSNKKYKIYKCPACASFSLRKLYKHIHEINYPNNRIIELQNIKNELENKNIINEENIININNVSCEIKNNNNNEINDNNMGNNQYNNYYVNERLYEEEKSNNEKKNIFECKIIKSDMKKKLKKPKKSKKIIIQIEKVIAPEIKK